jgi:hypothetical protein
VRTDRNKEKKKTKGTNIAVNRKVLNILLKKEEELKSEKIFAKFSKPTKFADVPNIL